jgi:uncharacterized protein (TIGR03084 family)
VDGHLLADLAEEGDTLAALLEGLTGADWMRPTPAVGWTVADSVRHLVVSDRVALASVVEGRDPLDGPGPAPVADPLEGLAGAWHAARAELLEAFARGDGRERVPWGGRRMASRTLATARLMEYWAHGLDCFAALEVTPVDTGRLAHIAWLGWRTLDHAFAVAGIEPAEPAGRLRLELVAPDGTPWTYGPADGPSRIVGQAGDWCRLVTHRVRRPPDRPLEATGPLAEQALVVARAFL